jgi:excisionase family DNA binding protein
MRRARLEFTGTYEKNLAREVRTASPRLMAGATMKTFSVAEAAKELGVSAGTVYGLCASRKLRHERHGLRRGRIRIAEDLAAEQVRRRLPSGKKDPLGGKEPRRRNRG